MPSPTATALLTGCVKPASTSSRPGFNLHAPRRTHFKSLSRWTLLLSVLATLSFVAAEKKNITLTFKDDNGTVLGTPQTIDYTICVPLNTSSFQPAPAADGTTSFVPYSSVAASEDHAALNLYSDTFCQVLTSSTVGLWNNTAPVANTSAIRWEGTAPAGSLPGQLSPTAFSPGMAVQTKVPDADGENGKGGKKGKGSDDDFVMDPVKGRIVVGLVSAILIVGVIMGVYQVYKAAQYVPPVRSVAKQSPAERLIGGKKVKRKDAYYKKPSRGADSDSLLTATAGGGAGSYRDTSSRAKLVNNSSMQERSRQDRFSVATADVHGGQGREDLMAGTGFESILIDMQETNTSTPSSFRRPWNSSRGDSHSSSSSTTATAAADLIQFGNEHGPYNTTPVSSSQMGAGAGRAGAGGRGGEVLVPMNNLGRRQSPTRRVGRSQ